MPVLFANFSQLVLAGAVHLTQDGFHAADQGPSGKLDTISNDIF